MVSLILTQCSEVFLYFAQSMMENLKIFNIYLNFFWETRLHSAFFFCVLAFVFNYSKSNFIATNLKSLLPTLWKCKLHYIFLYFLHLIKRITRVDHFLEGPFFSITDICTHLPTTIAAHNPIRESFSFFSFNLTKGKLIVKSYYSLSINIVLFRPLNTQIV